MAQQQTASAIYLLRHAEKPDEKISGVLPNGDQDKKSLSVKGWQRAGALVPYFGGTGTAAGKPVPQFLYASRSSSLRPQMTLLPLAEKLNLTIDLTFGKGDEEQLAASAKASGGVVLIAWQHDFMSAVANAILGDRHSAPQEWPPDRFDVTWVFRFDQSTNTYRFFQSPQLLLAGDQETEISHWPAAE